MDDFFRAAPSSGESKVSVQVLIDKHHNTIWATQKSIAELFDVNKSSVSRHISNIYKEGELSKDMRVCHKSMAHPLLCYLLHNPRSIVAYSKKGIILYRLQIWGCNLNCVKACS